MALSGQINGVFSGKPDTENRKPLMTWSATQNSAGNYSDVTVLFIFWQRTSTYYSYNLNTSGSSSHLNTVNINGDTHGGQITTPYDTRNTSGNITLRTHTTRVYHDANGNANVWIGWSGNTNTARGTYNFGETVSLNQITRATTVTTADASSVGNTSATTGGNVTDTGVPANTSRGVYWGTTAGSQPNQVVSGSGGGAFNANITGLTGGTTYYYKAYSYNTSGYAYGSVKSFTTTSIAPTVTTTSPASAVSYYTAIVLGNVSSDGGASVTEKGVCYNTTGNPTIADSKGTTGTGTGAISSNLTGLTANTLYYARAYATNSVGTSYGAQITFTTAISSPLATTSPTVDEKTNTQAHVYGEITASGGATITERGFVYGLTSNPTTANSKVVIVGTTGEIDYLLTGLVPGTLYYVRAFATNSEGTGYGDNRSFTTLPNNPSNLSVTVTGKTVSTLSWTKGGEYSLIRRQLGSPPANAFSGTEVYSGTASSTSDSGMSPGGHYYYRVWSSVTADGLTAISSGYSGGDIVTITDFEDPEHALLDDSNYATVSTSEGKLFCQVSKNGGSSWSSPKELTYGGLVESKSFGEGALELWGVSFNGGDISDANLRVKLSTDKAYQVYKNFGFNVDPGFVLTGLEVEVKAAYSNPDLLVYYVKVGPRYGTSPLPVKEGSLAYDLDKKRAVVYNGTGWDSGGSGYPWRGLWVTSTAYSLNDLIQYDGSGYICIEAHTSGTFATDLAASKWEIYVEGLVPLQSWQSPTLQNSWVNYGGDYNPAGYYKERDRVYLRGLVKSGTVNPTTGVIFTLPAGYRPPNIEIFGNISNSLFAECRINKDGAVIAYAGSNTWYSLDGISFRVA